MNMKRVLAFLLAACLVLGLCACSGGSGETQPSETQPVDTTPVQTVPTTQPAETQPADDGLTSYTVKVVDTDGNPIVGAMVQLCLDSCIPGVTDAEGVASFRVAEADYKVSFLMLPAGYDYTTEEQEFYFDSGATDITLTLKVAG